MRETMNTEIRMKVLASEPLQSVAGATPKDIADSMGVGVDVVLEHLGQLRHDGLVSYGFGWPGHRTGYDDVPLTVSLTGQGRRVLASQDAVPTDYKAGVAWLKAQGWSLEEDGVGYRAKRGTFESGWCRNEQHAWRSALEYALIDMGW